MKRIVKGIGVLVLAVAAVGQAAAQGVSGNGTVGGDTSAEARARRRGAQDAALAAIQDLQTAGRALKAHPDDADARRRLHAALDRVLDARKALADSRRQAGSATPAGGAAPAPRTIPQDQRYVLIQNETSKAVTAWVRVYARGDTGAWAWLPAEAAPGGTAGDAAAYRLEPGQSAYVVHQGRKLAGSKIRFWVRWQGGEYTAYRTHDFWLVPEVDGGAHVYRAAAVQTYPLRLTP